MKPLKASCPRCRVELRRRVAGGVEQRVCPSCYGFAVDFHALRAILESQEVAALRASALAAKNGDLGCAHCTFTMRRLEQPAHEQVIELDACSDCDLMWFDSGEWQDVATHSIAVPAWKTLVALAGLPVEEEADVYTHRPWASWVLLAAVSAVSIFGFFHMDWALHGLGHYAGRAFPENISTALTSFFVHAGWPHLLFNLYFFWVFSDNVEDQLGKWRFVLLLVCATLLGNFLADGLDPRLRYTPAVGASAGISALIAYYLARFPRRRFVLVLLFKRYSLPAVYFGGIYFFKEIVGTFLDWGGGTPISHLAHLGGATAGVIFALVKTHGFGRRTVGKFDA